MSCPLQNMTQSVLQSDVFAVHEKNHPFWGLGFRPFFFLGSVLSVVLLLLWGCFLSGIWQGIAGRNMLLWHVHEMLFGFGVAIVAGFLLTATQNWTGIRGVNGKPLMMLTLLWLLPRILFFVEAVPLSVLTVLDLFFLPVLAVKLKPYLKKSPRNQIFYALLGGLWLGNLFWHAGALGYFSQTTFIGTGLAVKIMVLMMVVIGGRIIPFFTGNAVPGARTRVYPKLETAVLIGTVVFVIVGTVFAGHPHLVFLNLVLFGLHLARWLSWDPWASRHVPILWILYSGYLWLVLGFLMAALAPLFGFMPSLSTHAFTAGAMGILIYGMVTRVSLGHSGRPIHASRPIVAGYVLLNVATFVRVFAPVLSPAHYELSLLLAAGLWVLAFAILVVVYGPVFWSMRADGRVG